jgi:hypothetical protein
MLAMRVRPRLAAAAVAASIVGGCVQATPSGTPSATVSTAPSASATATPRPTPAPAYWVDATAETIGDLAEWSNKVELADLEADGDIDILLANGGNYETPGDPVPTRALINDGSGRFTDRSTDVFGEVPNLARVVKARDVDGDDLVDIVIGTTYQTQTRLFLGRGGLAFEEVTTSHLPNAVASVGDLEIGDLDGDGDLDMVLADWGPGNPMQGAEAAPIVWLAGDDGRFTKAPDGAVPDRKLGFSWDIELLDVDNDLDLDILESCKVCEGGLLLHNDGTGRFTDASTGLPQSPNNYEYEPMDLDGDGFLDLVTINDGPNFTEHLLRGDGRGGFVDATAELWPSQANMPGDDNVIVYLDAESDGDADFVIGALDVADRLLVNDGTGKLSLELPVFSGPATPGTLGMAMADLDGDHLIDVVQAQGEAAVPETVHRGNAIPPDTAAPIFPLLRRSGETVIARVTDHSSAPTVDLTEVVVEGEAGTRPMRWYGESLWRLDVGDETVRVCAADRAGNRACSDEVSSA